MKKIYLCSPYSDPDPEVKRLRWIHVCQILGDLKREHPEMLFYSPIAHSYPIVVYGGLHDTLEFWWPLNKTWIDWADEVWIAAMPERLVSHGIMDFEIPYAQDNKKLVVWL